MAGEQWIETHLDYTSNDMNRNPCVYIFGMRIFLISSMHLMVFFKKIYKTQENDSSVFIVMYSHSKYSWIKR